MQGLGSKKEEGIKKVMVMNLSVLIYDPTVVAGNARGFWSLSPSEDFRQFLFSVGFSHSPQRHLFGMVHT
ncbi:hypothetical protein XA68_11690 [Ophiocordyceps unilateralis]|uniref:Uncharacterized protein n=1 Tax=Ophiocordyceps unilateralis TaxID=268505 RepID=A0A2A9PFY3_OPHUN|nr:hypothetical protein XA68_11690 [Ophiocordyceps unilateralis]